MAKKYCPDAIRLEADEIIAYWEAHNPRSKKLTPRKKQKAEGERKHFQHRYGKKKHCTRKKN